MTLGGPFYIIRFNIHDPVVTKFSPYVEINTLSPNDFHMGSKECKMNWSNIDNGRELSVLIFGVLSASLRERI
jgi:hypothetical protein